MMKWWMYFLEEAFWILCAPRHHGKGGQQKQAEVTSVQDQQRETADLGQQKSLTGAAQGTLGQFEGPVDKSPFYQSLLRSGTQSTSNAYDAAKASMAQRSNQSGFGYNQPVAQAGQGQVDTSEARALGAIPDEAMVAAAPLSMQAAGESGQLGMGYGSQALGFGGQNLQSNDQAAKLQSRRSGLWNQLFGAGEEAFGMQPTSGGYY